MRFTDIHTHFLPALDDGPKTLADTVEMLRFAHAGGTRAIVATPHMFQESFGNFEIAKVNDVFAHTVGELKEWSGRPGLEFLAELKLYLGAENMADSAFLEALDQNRVLTLNGSRYILIEFGLNLPSRYLLSVVDRVLARGLVPVLAHVERYSAVRRDPGLLARLLEKGCLTQVNAESFEGSFWSRGRRFALDLLTKNLISLIASDSHGAHYRPPQMLETFQKVESRVGLDQAETLFWRNPQWVVAAGEGG